MKIEKLHQLFLNSSGVNTDTRNTKPGQIFFGLKGENFNGNTFASKAIANGASHAIIDEEEFDRGENYILVKDVLETLQKLATHHRNYLSTPILAITGSNGKTTSKELINAVLGKKFKTVATAGNFNNHIGVPLTLLSMDKDTEFGIVEMGANHAKEIAALCNIAEPDFGYITNFGKAHIEGFGSLEGVVKAKSELYDHIKENGKLLFLNYDDPIQQKHTSHENTYSFGTSPNADVQVEYRYRNETAEVVMQGRNYKSYLYGSYNAVNIAAALCIGSYFKLPAEAMEEAVASYIPTNNRSQLIKLGELTVLMDAYNANPTSMKATLESFQRSSAKDKVVILGDMFELGNTAEEEHQYIASYLEELKFKQALLVGSNFSKVSSKPGYIQKFETFQELLETVKATNFGSSHILIKGSRGMALERILEVLKDKTLQE